MTNLQPRPRVRTRSTAPSNANDAVQASRPSVLADPTVSDEEPADDFLVQASLPNRAASLPTLKVAYVPTDRLTPASRRVRRAGRRQQECLERALRRFDFVYAILARRDGTVVSGHGLLEAAKALGLERVPVTYVDWLTDNEIRALTISLHKIEELSDWDEEALKAEFEYLVEVEPDLVMFTGFSTAEVDVRLDAVATKSDAADELPEVMGPTVSRLGDLWLFDKGGHRLLCGDALDPVVLAALMEAERARLVLSDPPFNVKIAGHVSGRKGAREFAMAAGEMTPAEFQRFLKAVFVNASKVSLDGSLALYFMDWRHMREMLGAGYEVYDSLKNLIVWAKSNAGMGSLWRSQHELVFAWKLGSAPHVNNVELGKNGRWRSNLWQHAGANAFGRTRDEDLAGHVTPKSVALLHDAILDVTNRGDAVLDPFAGAGSTLVAAHRAKRVGYGVEIDPVYVDTAVRRLEKFTKAPARLAATGQTFDDVMAERCGAQARSA